MMLNKEAYKVTNDNLIYDSSHPLDARNVPVTVQTGTPGTVKRGQVLDFESTGYKPHAENGTVSAVVAEDTPYTGEDATVAVPVYISGTFRETACITDTALSAQDREEFRSKGIYLK